MKKIRVGIVGYGNVGRGVIKAVDAASDMELAALFTRRDPKTLDIADSGIPICNLNDAEKMKDEIDVLALCGGSATDLAEQGPRFAASFNVVDSFDTHARIPEYMAEVNAAAKNTTAIISSGWDPGLFSMMRLMFETFLPDGISYTFWGKGISQGHSDAVRHVEGVKDGVQYTIPVKSAIESVRRGERPVLDARQKHTRQCYVVAEPGADEAALEEKIKTMPHYFADYNTTVTFVKEDDLKANHSKMPHGGTVLHSGRTGENEHVMEFLLKLDSNPEFTGSVVAAYARAAVRLAAERCYGAKTVFDVPLAYLSEKSRAVLVKELL